MGDGGNEHDARATADRELDRIHYHNCYNDGRMVVADAMMPEYANQRGCYVSRGEASMTWVDIAAALGYQDPSGRGRKAVIMLYRSGISKLRRRPGALEKLRSIAAARASFIREHRLSQSLFGGTRA